MSSLRRDLFERRLWPIVVLLVIAVAAVPMLLRGSAHADLTPVPPAPHTAAAMVTNAERTAVAPATTHALQVSIPRDPFAGGMPTLKTKPESQTGASTGAAGATQTGASQSTTTSASMVSPSPAGSSSTTPGASADAASGGGTSSSTTTTPATSTTASGSTSSSSTGSSTASGSGSASSAQDTGSWTEYRVSLRFGAAGKPRTHSDLPRLAPLPSATNPKAMFLGVMGGSDAVFMLGAGMVPSGPGLCRPSHTHCAVILLKAGQTEQLKSASGIQFNNSVAGQLAPANATAAQQYRLTVTSIAKQVTHSRSDALAAYQRVSPAGQCELDMGDPVAYSQTEGALSNVANPACRGQQGLVPFPGTVIAP